MRKILKYFGFYDNGKTTVTEKQCNINSVSKSLGYDPSKVWFVNGRPCSDKEYQGWKMSSFETIEGYLHAIGK
tara:strand:- start:109 stop:327 length:219 start_codon:yes stop_codon:yes gene_type:complete